jgi:hypothetical protein
MDLGFMSRRTAANPGDNRFEPFSINPAAMQG